MPKWSLAQSNAINHVGKNIVVSASAGSGKTAVLTARMVKRITQDRISVDKLLAMTFTDAAAAEMKNRLYSGLNEVLLTTDDEELKTYCINQCTLLSDAMICTIHSFCLNVISENYFVLHLSNNQISHIFSDEEMRVIQNEAMEYTLSTLKQKNAALFNHVSNYFDNRPDSFENLKAALIKISNAALNQSDIEAFFDNILTKAIKNHYELDPLIKEYLFLGIMIDIVAIKERLNEILQLYSSEGVEDAVLQNVELKLKHIAVIVEAINNENYREFIRTLHGLAKVKSITSKEKKADYVNKKITVVNKRLQKLIAQYFEEDTLLNDNKDLYPIVEFLVKGSRLYLNNLDIIKKQNEGINFSDMEQLAYKILLANDNQVAKKYQERFDEILVDEFQDTNEFQNAMIELISRGNNLFRVGDIKQSIYRFRGAKPAIMSSLMKRNDEHNELIVLGHNYRSNKSVVEFNNALFNKMMNIPYLNNEFSDYDHAEIGTLAQDDHYALPVEFIKIIDDEDQETSDVKQIRANALILAQKILDLKHTSEFVRWSDYCVLVRSHELKKDLCYVFDELNIPYSTTVNSGLYNAYAVQICISYLQMLVDNTSDIDTVAVLSNLYLYQDEDLVTLRFNKNKRSYFNTVTEIDKKFEQDYINIKNCYHNLGIAATVNEILKINDFYWLKTNNQERANIDLFMQRVISFEESSSNLTIFLQQIQNSLDVKSNTAVSASKNEDVVQITTVHQSKGLQYPVVFFWSNNRTTINETRENVLVDDLLGLGLSHLRFPYRYKRDTLTQLAIKTKVTLEEFEENVRLYYVALTRAQKLALIVGSVSDSYSPDPLSLTTFFDKKGSTDLILSSMSEINTNAYCETTIQSNYTSSHQAQKQPLATYAIPSYTYKRPSNNLKLSSPSLLKQKRFQPLNYKTTSGSDYGTRIHKLIELLPTLPWTKDLILSIDNSCKDYDIQRLLNLAKQPLFIKCYQGIVEKEFSFAVENNDEIIHGYIDFISILEEEVIIIDFKSDVVDTVETLRISYLDQMQAYSTSIKLVYPNKKITVYLYSLRLDQFIAI